MAISFSFKIAPGVRIRAGKRGLRTSIGPRAARIHVGGGYRTTLSSGAGPVTLYSAVGRKRTEHTAARRVATSRVSGPTPAQADKADEVRRLASFLDHLSTLHRGAFPPAAPPVAPPPVPPDEAAIRARHAEQAVAGISHLHLAERRAAEEAAAGVATKEIHEARAASAAAQVQAQRELDAHWAALVANDPDVVLATLTEAFADNEAPAGVTGVVGDEVSIALLVPGLVVVPDHLPSTTPAGNVTIKKMTKAVRNGFYVNLVCGHLLAAARETFAVCPGVHAVRGAVLRSRPPDAYGKIRHEVLLAARFTREALAGVAWDTVAAGTVFSQVGTEVQARFVGQAHDLGALDLADHPDLAAVLTGLDGT